MAVDDDSSSKKEDSKDKSGALGDTLKKVFTAGVSAAFMTEESIRSYMGDMKLPKEVLNVLLASANKSKDEITQKVTKELMNVVGKIDFVKELSKFAETHKFKITAEIDIIKKETSKKTDSES